jgi:hypothetical protein
MEQSGRMVAMDATKGQDTNSNHRISRHLYRDVPA